MTQTATRGDLEIGHWRRHGWKYLLGLVIVIFLFGIGDMVAGLDADPAIAEGISGMSPEEIRAEHELLATLVDTQVRAGGLQLLMLGLLWGVIVVVPFRRGERWAWYLMWTFPAWSTAVSLSFLFIDLQPDEPIPPPAISGWVFMVLSALLLLVTRTGDPAASASRQETETMGNRNRRS